jgi:hypothetical protein
LQLLPSLLYLYFVSFLTRYTWSILTSNAVTIAAEAAAQPPLPPSCSIMLLLLLLLPLMLLPPAASRML